MAHIPGRSLVDNRRHHLHDRRSETLPNDVGQSMVRIQRQGRPSHVTPVIRITDSVALDRRIERRLCFWTIRGMGLPFAIRPGRFARRLTITCETRAADSRSRRARTTDRASFWFLDHTGEENPYPCEMISVTLLGMFARDFSCGLARKSASSRQSGTKE